MKFLALLLCLFSAMSYAGDIKEFVREYTYNASETDSKVSARKAAMQQLQSLLIQEVGVQIHSSFDQTEKLNGDEFDRKVQANYKTFVQALTKTKILEQKWDGENFYLKARIKVDTGNLTEQIKLVYIGGVSDGKPSQKTCKSVHNKAIDMLAEANRPEIVNQLVEYSQQYPIDNDCYKWQIGIIKNFTSLELDPAGYRQNLFERIEKEGSSYAGSLMLHVLRYAMAIRPLSESEWQTVKNTLQRSTKHSNGSTVDILVQHTKIENLVNANEYTQKRNANYQTLDELQKKLAELTKLAKANKLGTPKTYTFSDLASSILNKTIKLQPSLFVVYYKQVYQQLDKNVIQRLANNVINDFKKSPDSGKLEFLDFYISTLEVDRNSKRFLFSLVLDLRKNRQGKAEFDQALAMLLKKHPQKVTEAIKSGRYNKQKKEQMLIEYQLADNSIKPLADYAKLLSDKKSQKQQSGAEYLLAFGKRAEPAKPQVQKVLSRIKEIGKVQSPRNLVVALLRVMDNIEARDDKSIELMIWAVGDIDGEINKKAYESLVKVGAVALPVIKQHYSGLKSTAQRRLVEIIGTYTQDKHNALTFLKTLKPGTPQQKFALEDAISALQ